MAAPTADFPLHRPELLETLSRGDALLTAAMSEDRRRFKKGDEIVCEGERCDTIFRLESGWVARARILDDGRRSLSTVFLPGDLFGVKSFLLTEQPDSVISLGPTTALAIRHDRLRQLFETEPSVALRIAFQLGEDERRLHNYVIGLGRANAAERLATMLLELHGRLARVGLAENGTYRIPLTQQEIGDFTAHPGACEPGAAAAAQRRARHRQQRDGADPQHDRAAPGGRAGAGHFRAHAPGIRRQRCHRRRIGQVRRTRKTLGGFPSCGVSNVVKSSCRPV
jgi:CRP/FNR family transcriptional regulator, anaerobic regulatory protein